MAIIVILSILFYLFMGMGTYFLIVARQYTIDCPERFHTFQHYFEENWEDFIGGIFAGVFWPIGLPVFLIIVFFINLFSAWLNKFDNSEEDEE